MTRNVCLEPRCPNLVQPGQRTCPEHTPTQAQPGGSSALTTRGSTRAWRRTRQRTLDRDAGVCRNCGQATATRADHIRPRSQGGNDNDANLQALCTRCDNDKRVEETPDSWSRHAG